MEYLISLGHESIGYVGACNNEARYRGYVETLETHGLQVDADYVINTKQSEVEGYEAMERLMKQAHTLLHQIVIIHGALAADKFQSCAGTYHMCISNLFCLDTGRYGNIAQMHTDQRVADIHSGTGLNMFDGSRFLERLVGCGGEGTAGFRLRYDIDLWIAEFFGSFRFKDQCTV